MPRFSLKTLFSVVSLIALGISGLLLRDSDVVAGLARGWLDTPLLFGSWILIGEALILPFWRPAWITIAALAFGAWIGIVMAFIYMAFNFIAYR